MGSVPWGAVITAETCQAELSSRGQVGTGPFNLLSIPRLPELDKSQSVCPYAALGAHGPIGKGTTRGRVSIGASRKWLGN